MHSGMDTREPGFAEEASNDIQDDLRHRISDLLLEHVDPISTDAVAIFPYSGAEMLDAAYCGRLGHLLVQLLAYAVRDSRLDARGGFVGDLHRIVLERTLTMEQL